VRKRGNIPCRGMVHAQGHCEQRGKEDQKKSVFKLYGQMK